MPIDEPREGWVMDESDLEITEEAERAGEAYYRSAIGSGEVPVVSKATALSQYSASQFKEIVLRKAQEWEVEGQLAQKRAAVEAEVAFTYFCMRQDKAHPSEENLSQRLETLQWLCAYLK